MARRPRALLLDTHVLVWSVAGQEERRLRAVRAALERAAGAGLVHVSAISGFEVGLLAAVGRLRLDRPPALWFQAALARPGVRAVDVTPEIAVEAAALPGGLHGDPADRILVATARLRGLTLVTADGRLLDYAERGHVRALPVA